ncbi:helix-turn-helix domain-containing protein [Paenibacillus barengoltzii]
MKISEASRKERKSLGLTQGQMIKESKISVTHYSKMENGQNRIFIDDLI